MHKKFDDIVTQIMQDKDSGPFLQPVDFIGLNLLDYPMKIKNPMDLGTIKQNIKKYQNYDQIFADIQQIWNNCKVYNIEGSQIYKQAEKLEKLTNKIKKTIQQQQQNKKKQKEKSKKNIFIKKARSGISTSVLAQNNNATIVNTNNNRGETGLGNITSSGQKAGNTQQSNILNQQGSHSNNMTETKQQQKKNEPADISQKLKLAFMMKNTDEEKILEALNIVLDQWPYAITANNDNNEVKINLSNLDYPTAVTLENLFNERNGVL